MESLEGYKLEIEIQQFNGRRRKLLRGRRSSNSKPFSRMPLPAYKRVLFFLSVDHQFARHDFSGARFQSSFRKVSHSVAKPAAASASLQSLVGILVIVHLRKRAPWCGGNRFRIRRMHDGAFSEACRLRTFQAPERSGWSSRSVLGLEGQSEDGPRAFAFQPPIAPGGFFSK